MKVKRTPGPGLQQLKVMLANLKNAKAEVGYFKSAKYPDGTAVAQVFVTNEFGDPQKNIPPRPTIRPAIKKNRREWQSLAKDGAKAIAKSDLTINDVLEAIAGRAAGDWRKEIATIQEPKLSDVTIRMRRLMYANKSKNAPVSDKPLVAYYKLLLNSINHRVVKK